MLLEIYVQDHITYLLMKNRHIRIDFLVSTFIQSFAGAVSFILDSHCLLTRPSLKNPSFLGFTATGNLNLVRFYLTKFPLFTDPYITYPENDWNAQI